MASEEVEALVVGGGQAGLAMSEHLSRCGVAHLVLERNRIAERWRSERWDSLVANGPAWHDRFPGLEFSDIGPEEFASKERVADYFVDYAEKIAAPIRCGVEVTSARRNVGRPGFRVETSEGSIDARFVVAATGPFQRPVVPAIAPDDAGLMQIHSSGYRNPSQLPEGAVLVVGAGSSGVQIADELLRAGRRIYLSVGPHDRPPRRYRGRDFVWWLGVLGKWDEETPPKARSTSRSRSAAPMGATPSTSATWPTAAWCSLAERARSKAAPSGSPRTWPTTSHTVTTTTCHCSTRPMHMSPAMASTSRTIRTPALWDRPRAA